MTLDAISIHALREEGDEEPVEVPDISKIFLSTPSARRATFKRRQDVKLTIFLSTPSARRATTVFRDSSTITKISIHALREEGDRNLR